MFLASPHIIQLVVSPVVRKAGQLLLSRINEVALCIAYPESAFLSGTIRATHTNLLDYVRNPIDMHKRTHIHIHNTCTDTLHYFTLSVYRDTSEE